MSGWNLRLNERQDRRWLFSLAADPTEQGNPADVRRQKLGDLEALVEAHCADPRVSLSLHRSESPVCIDKTLADTPCENNRYIIWPNRQARGQAGPG